MAKSVIIVEKFVDPRPLRRVFDERFADPRSTRGDRFAWDYWHVPGQYTHLRTPAWTYFPKTVYDAFHQQLVAWGRETLGCHDVSPPWLSCYVEGHRQELHGDLPHGPWAFVYSLTNWRGRRFTGGETLMVRDDVLDFWSSFQSVRGVEEAEVLNAIEPKLGRLVVFDPRIPHGVREVRGTQDPREGRLVIHGWFVQPRPFVRGPLRVAALAARIDELSEAIPSWLDAPVAGLLSIAFDVQRDGSVSGLRTLSDTTRGAAVGTPIRRAIGTWRFGAQRGVSRVTLPLNFVAQ